MTAQRPAEANDHPGLNYFTTREVCCCEGILRCARGYKRSAEPLWLQARSDSRNDCLTSIPVFPNVYSQAFKLSVAAGMLQLDSELDLVLESGGQESGQALALALGQAVRS
jgi:hypothetical protein